MSITHEYSTFIVNLHAYITHVISGNLELTNHLYLVKQKNIIFSRTEADYPILEKLRSENFIKNIS